MEHECFLDVSDLEAPEPLIRALDRVKALSRGQFLHLNHRLKPCLLYDNLAELGYDHDTRAGSSGMCEVFIWRHGDNTAEGLARRTAEKLPLWRD